jgi:RimJ/RimL family protein N-acetyltransferase
MQMTIYAETPRLLLREIVAEDVHDLFELDRDPRVHRFLGNNPFTDIAQVPPIITFIRKQYEENGIGRWAVIEKATGDFLGWSGLKLEGNETNGHKDYYDLGYRFKPSAWNKGFATESAKAAVAFGFEEMRLPLISGATHQENTGSIRVFEKLGFDRIESFDHEGDRCYWFEKCNPSTLT